MNVKKGLFNEETQHEIIQLPTSSLQVFQIQGSDKTWTQCISNNTRSKMCCCHVGFHKTDSSSFTSQFPPCIVPVSLYPILLLLFLLWLALLKHLWNQFSLNIFCIYCSHSHLTTSRIIKESTAILSVFLHLNIWPWVGL